VEQLVASAEAAVEEVVKRGVSLFDLFLHINDIFYRRSLWSQDPLASDFYGSRKYTSNILLSGAMPSKS